MVFIMFLIFKVNRCSKGISLENNFRNFLRKKKKETDF